MNLISSSLQVIEKKKQI
ncbi:hypothetical protein Q0Y04_11060 [Clostridioides difficile]|nr:hypothetical protein Q0Y04_11060 [Clostridioides difficile]